MKLAFSTLGCPDWSWEDMVSTAKDFGFQGIEIRGIEHEMHAPMAKPFLSGNIKQTLSTLTRLRLEIPCLSSACYLFDKNHQNHTISEGEAYIDLASSIKTPFVRVLGDLNPEPLTYIDDNFVCDNLIALSDYAANKDVTLLIETNGVFSDSNRLLKLLEKVNRDNVGVLWDIHHPYRYFGESPAKTVEILGKAIKYAHVKDSVKNSDGTIKYKMMGSGDVPVNDAIDLLVRNNFNGYISLEWVKRWYIDLEDAGVVFMQFVNYINNQLNRGNI